MFIDFEWKLLLWFFPNSFTVCIFRSLWRAEFVIYHGASVRSLNVIYCKAWIGRILTGLAGALNLNDDSSLIICIAVICFETQIILSRHLSRWKRELGRFCFCLMWFHPVNLLSRVIHRYLVDWWSRIGLLLNFIGVIPFC